MIPQLKRGAMIVSGVVSTLAVAKKRVPWQKNFRLRSNSGQLLARPWKKMSAHIGVEVCIKPEGMMPNRTVKLLMQKVHLSELRNLVTDVGQDFKLCLFSETLTGLPLELFQLPNTKSDFSKLQEVNIPKRGTFIQLEWPCGRFKLIAWKRRGYSDPSLYKKPCR